MLSQEARIPISDRGFRFGDGVFETISVSGGVSYQWEYHLDRLSAGASEIRIPLPEINWFYMLRETLTQNKATEGFLRISVSRGDGSVGYLPAASVTPTWAIEYLPPRPMPTAPYTLWLSSYERAAPESMPTHHKLAQGLTSTLALMEAQDNHCDEALLIGAAGDVCSAAAANIFWIRNGTLFTPDIETGCLDGITRYQVLQLTTAPVEECEAFLEEFMEAEAAFITNSRLGIWPIATLQPMGKIFDAHHPMIAQLQAALTKEKANYISKNSVFWTNNS